MFALPQTVGRQLPPIGGQSDINQLPPTGGQTASNTQQAWTIFFLIGAGLLILILLAILVIILFKKFSGEPLPSGLGRYSSNESPRGVANNQNKLLLSPG